MERGCNAGDVLFCRPKENQKGRRCPEGMKAPVGLLSRGPVCEANAACSARQGRSDFDALDPTGCGTLRLLRALGGTRILQAAAPTAPPCIRRWRRSSPLQTKGCSPLIIPKLKSKRKKASAALHAFFSLLPLEKFTARRILHTLQVLQSRGGCKNAPVPGRRGTPGAPLLLQGRWPSAQ